MGRASISKNNRFVNSLGSVLKYLLNLPWLVVGKDRNKADEADFLDKVKVETVVPLAFDSPSLNKNNDEFGNNTFQGTIEEAINVLISYLKKENILVLGMGERSHGVLPKSTLIVPHLQMPLYNLLGLNHFLIEALFTDISSEEWNYIHKAIDKNFSPKDSIDIKVKVLRKIIEENPRILPKLNFNLQKIADKDGLLGIIITARELGMHLYGILTSEEVLNLSSDEVGLKITEKGISETLKILNLIDKTKSGRLMILCGDAHVACLPLKPTAEVKDTAVYMFGDSLFRDFKHPYLNLSLVVGTRDDLLKEKDAFGEAGLQFYLNQHNDENFKIGDVKLFYIRDENQHRILFIYNTPLRK